MMHRLFIIILFFIIACSSDKVPADLLQPGKMQEVLLDMMRADDYLNNHVMGDTVINRDSFSLQLYQKIYQLHHIDKTTFDSSLHYYELHPEILKPILDSLELALQRSPGADAPVLADSAVKVSPRRLEVK